MKKVIFAFILGVISLFIWFSQWESTLLIKAYMSHEKSKGLLTRIYLERGDLDSYFYWIHRLDTTGLEDNPIMKNIRKAQGLE